MCMSAEEVNFTRKEKYCGGGRREQASCSECTTRHASLSKAKLIQDALMAANCHLPHIHTSFSGMAVWTVFGIEACSRGKGFKAEGAERQEGLGDAGDARDTLR